MKRLFCLLLAFVMLCGCTAATSETTIPETAAGPTLRPGFYIPADESAQMGMIYVELLSDGTGAVSLLGTSQPDINWTETGFDFYDVPAVPTADGFTADGAEFLYTGDSLPEGYLPDPPQPGTYCISSIGYQGNMEIFGAADSDDNCMTLKPDGTGRLIFRGTGYDLTWNGSLAELEGGYYLMLVDMGDQGGDPPLVMGYVMETECPIEADSIAFRLMEGE